MFDRVKRWFEAARMPMTVVRTSSSAGPAPASPDRAGEGFRAAPVPGFLQRAAGRPNRAGRRACVTWTAASGVRARGGCDRLTPLTGHFIGRVLRDTARR